MKFSTHLIEGTFIARLNRFAALVRIGGRDTVAHVANSGRLHELLQKGHRVLLSPVDPLPSRKTLFNLSLVDVGHTLVSTDARLPNTLVHEAIGQSRLVEFEGYTDVLREQFFGDSRLDLLLTNGHHHCYVEVKSVTLVTNEIALFPDAPTIRGRRHVDTLASAIRHGRRAAVVFVVQRSDAKMFAPHDKADPAFATALRQAHKVGVEIFAYRCLVNLQEVTLADRLPLLLNGLNSQDTPCSAANRGAAQI